MNTPFRKRLISRANRVLDDLVSYTPIQHSNQKQEILDLFSLRPDETCLGIYKNNLDTLDNSILFTNEGFRVYINHEESYIPYSELKEVHWKEKDKTKASNIEIYLKNNDLFNLPVLGGEGRFRDLFGVLRFLKAIISDVEQFS